ncbi:MAG: hypothetical protein KDC57_22465 [Saprospiraceae bacterium]|nr:hypothetical protein [Saprospiraceae bacterium]
MKNVLFLNTLVFFVLVSCNNRDLFRFEYDLQLSELDTIVYGKPIYGSLQVISPLLHNEVRTVTYETAYLCIQSIATSEIYFFALDNINQRYPILEHDTYMTYKRVKRSSIYQWLIDQNAEIKPGYYYYYVKKYDDSPHKIDSKRRKIFISIISEEESRLIDSFKDDCRGFFYYMVYNASIKRVFNCIMKNKEDLINTFVWPNCCIALLYYYCHGYEVDSNTIINELNTCMEVLLPLSKSNVVIENIIKENLKDLNARGIDYQIPIQIRNDENK